MRYRKRIAQVALEYVAVISLVVTTILLMKLWMLRGIQGGFKKSADSVGVQFDAQRSDAIRIIKSDSKIFEKKQYIVTQSNGTEFDKIYTPPATSNSTPIR